MTDDRDITERLEDPSYDGAIYMRQDAAKEIRVLRHYVAHLEDQLADEKLEFEELYEHSSKQALDIVTLGQEVGRLREALIRIETLADEMMVGRSSYVGAIRDTARAALAEKEKK